MSDTPNDESGDGSQGDQSQGGQGGNQPQGNQGDGQAQGGQAPGGQAPSGQAGGQPPQGQPQSGQPAQGQAPQGQPAQGGAQPQGQAPQGQAQRAPVDTGPSVGDIFSRNDTLDQIKLGVVMYAIVGFGLGLGLFGIGNAFSGGSGTAAAFASGLAIFGSIGAPLAIGPLLAYFIGGEIGNELADVEDNLVFATAGVTALGGSIVAFFLSWIMLGLGAGSVSFNNIILPIILSGIGAAIVAVGRIWAEENLLGPSGAPPQQGRQQY
jgi:hypothetical protein